MTILVERDGAVATLRLHRPDRLNAFTEAMVEELLKAVEAVSLDPEVRCVVLAGSGRGFCAGYDLGDAAAAMPRIDEAAQRMVLHAQIPILLKRMPKPVICAMRGPVAGTGVVLAAACDLRFASTTARFKLAFASAGRCGDPGGSFLFTQLLGPMKARELYLLDPKMDAAQALEIGLVNEVVEDDALDARVTELATQLAAGPTGAFASMKRNLNAAETGTLEETVAAEATANAHASLSHDGKEAAYAFLEKRAPNFRGY